MPRHPTTRVDATATRSALLVGVALAALLLQGCDMCEIGDLRCNGSAVEECNSNRNWEEFHDCGAAQCAVGQDACAGSFIPVSGPGTWCCRTP